MTALLRETWFLSRDRAALVWLLIALISASCAVAFGLGEVASQRATIDRLRAADVVERDYMAEQYRDWGSAGYYTFHLTYDPPSDFAFAALGQRDSSPWKHRIRMLALEGQIYETDAANPDFALTGRFDYAFVVAMLAPLFLILLLHDLKARERAFGRFELLEASASGLWRVRAGLRVAALGIALLLPLILAGSATGSGVASLFLAGAAVLLHLLFWWLVVAWINQRGWTASVNLTALFGAWLVLAVVAPAGIKLVVDTAIEIPDGGDIILTQREAVNDAWDLPVSATMEPFLERHPEWSDHATIEGTFEWKWYYAFQQVGDQNVEALSIAYREGRDRRDRLSSILSWLTPPAKMERIFQSLANTDVEATRLYESRVRAYHAQLRTFYYPKLFLDAPFTDEAVAERPIYVQLR